MHERSLARWLAGLLARMHYLLACPFAEQPTFPLSPPAAAPAPVEAATARSLGWDAWMLLQPKWPPPSRVHSQPLVGIACESMRAGRARGEHTAAAAAEKPE